MGQEELSSWPTMVIFQSRVGSVKANSGNLALWPNFLQLHVATWVAASAWAQANEGPLV